MLAAAGAEAVAEPGRTGSFEIVRDGETVFSKLESGRFPDDAEIAALTA